MSKGALTRSAPRRPASRCEPVGFEAEEIEGGSAEHSRLLVGAELSGIENHAAGNRFSEGEWVVAPEGDLLDADQVDQVAQRGRIVNERVEVDPRDLLARAPAGRGRDEIGAADEAPLDAADRVRKAAAAVRSSGNSRRIYLILPVSIYFSFRPGSVSL